MRRLAVCAPAAIVLLAVTRPAWGDATVGAFDNPSAGTVSASASTGPPSSAGPVVASDYSDGADPCQYTWISGSDLPGPDGSTNGAWAVPSASDPSYCVNGLQPGQFFGVNPYWVPTGNTGPAAPTPRNLAVQALSQAKVVQPQVQTWPPSGHGEVNFPTWVHVASWAPVTTTATAGPVTVTVTATPIKTIVSSVDSSDGGTTYPPVQITCPGPGTAYDPSRPYADQHTDCSITWSWPSAHHGSGSTYGTYPLTVTVVYAVTWTGPGGGGALPAIARSSTVDYPVGEIEAIGS